MADAPPGASAPGAYPQVPQQAYPPQAGYPPQQGAYPPQQGGYPPQQGGYPAQPQAYPGQPGQTVVYSGGYPGPQQVVTTQGQVMTTNPVVPAGVMMAQPAVVVATAAPVSGADPKGKLKQGPLIGALVCVIFAWITQWVILFVPTWLVADNVGVGLFSFCRSSFGSTACGDITDSNWCGIFGNTSGCAEWTQNGAVRAFLVIDLIILFALLVQLSMVVCCKVKVPKIAMAVQAGVLLLLGFFVVAIAGSWPGKTTSDYSVGGSYIGHLLSWLILHVTTTVCIGVA